MNKGINMTCRRQLSSFALALTMVITMIAPASAADTVSRFNDTVGHWAESAIEQMADAGYIGGYEDGGFHPDAPITRAEVAAILQNMQNYSVKNTGEFQDVADGAWYADAVYALKAAGFISGDTASTFAPLQNIKRQDAMLIVAKILGMDENADMTDVLDDFTDRESVSAYARQGVAFMVAEGYVSGRNGNRLEP